MNGAVWLQQLHFEQLHRVDLVHALGPTVHRRGVGQKATRVDGSPGGDPLRRGAARGQGQLGQCVRGGVLAEAPGQGMRMRVTDVIEGDDVDQRRRRGALGLHQRGIRARRTTHRLCRVVDQDVQRPLRGHLVGEGNHLGRVTQVDPHDPQPVQPVAAVLHRGEAAHRVVGKPGGYRGVRPITQ